MNNNHETFKNLNFCSLTDILTDRGSYILDAVWQGLSSTKKSAVLLIYQPRKSNSPIAFRADELPHEQTDLGKVYSSLATKK